MEIGSTNFLQRRVVEVEEEKPMKNEQKKQHNRIVEKKSRKKISWGLVPFILAIIGLAGGLVYLYLEYQKTQNKIKALKDPQKRLEFDKEQAEEVVKKLCKIMLCPNEEYTVAIITDIETAKNENPVFFKDARNGDRFILFKTKAVIFREEENLIINVAPYVYNPQNSTENESNKQQNQQTIGNK